MSGPWTPEEDSILRRRRAEGAYSKAIAKELNRTSIAIDARALRIGARFVPEARKIHREKYTAIHVNEVFYEKLSREAARRGIRVSRLVRDLMEPQL